MNARRMTCLALMALTATAACADDEVTVQLNAHDGHFSPPRLDVPSGKRIRIEITNTGPGAVEFESTELRKEKVLAPGARSVVVIVPLKPGEYYFFDDFNPGTGKGVLVVR